MNSAEVSSGIQHMATVQDSGPITLYLIDTRPKDFSYDPLHSLIYLVTQPIPRDLEGQAQRRAGHRDPGGRARPGEGLQLRPRDLRRHRQRQSVLRVLPIYAILFAIALGFLDRVCRLNPTNPFVLTPGVGGRAHGYLRGEMGLFVFRCFFMFVTAWFGMWAVAELMIASGLQLTGGGTEDAEQLDEYADYGEEIDNEPPPQNPDAAPAREDFPSLAGHRPDYGPAGGRPDPSLTIPSLHPSPPRNPSEPCMSTELRRGFVRIVSSYGRGNQPCRGHHPDPPAAGVAGLRGVRPGRLHRFLRGPVLLIDEVLRSSMIRELAAAHHADLRGDNGNSCGPGVRNRHLPHRHRPDGNPVPHAGAAGARLRHLPVLHRAASLLILAEGIHACVMVFTAPVYNMFVVTDLSRRRQHLHDDPQDQLPRRRLDSPVGRRHEGPRPGR